MKRNIGFLALFLAISSLAFAFSTTYKTPGDILVKTALVDSSGEYIEVGADSGYRVIGDTIYLGECKDIRSIIGSIIVDSGETSDGTPATHGYGLEDSVVIRFGTRLKNHTGHVVLDSAVKGALPCTLWVSHIANDTLFKDELFLEYEAWDTAQTDTLEDISLTHDVKWNLVGRQ